MNPDDSGAPFTAEGGHGAVPTKGVATGVVADAWTMVEPNMPVNMDFAPWDPATGPKKSLKDSFVHTISQIAVEELSQNVDAQSNQNSMYFSGKVIKTDPFPANPPFLSLSPSLPLSGNLNK